MATFAGNMLAYGRDHYGSVHSPLFVNQLDVRTRSLPEPGTGVWHLEATRRMGGSRTGSNFHFDTGLLRLLQGLSAITGDPRYAQAVEDNLAWLLAHVHAIPVGQVVRGDRLVLPGGDHLLWDVLEDRPRGNFHEMRSSRLLWPEMFALDPRATTAEIGTFHAHLVQPETGYAFNRHYPLPLPPGTPPPAPALSLPSSAGVYLHGWAFLHARTGEARYLEWARGLAGYYWDHRGKETDIPPSSGERGSKRNAFDTPASRLSYGLEPWRSYVAFLLYVADELGEEKGVVFRRQAEAFLRAYARYGLSADGGFYRVINIDTGKPGGTAAESTPDHAIWRSTRFHQVFATLAWCYRETRLPELRKVLDVMGEAFSRPEASGRNGQAREIALPLLAFTWLYQATGDSVFLDKAAPYVTAALERYYRDGFFVSGPAPGQEARCDPWAIYSNRSGSAHLALAVLRYELLRAGLDAGLLGDDVVVER
ncbi:MAG: hypothetical protein LBK99_14145 [Opitutaceae bacterium]|nr:hypothetical protein [Opitutaceae bacterium]